LKKVYHNATDTVCVTLIVDLYVMYAHVVLFLCVRRKGPAGAGRCEDGIWHYVLLNKRRGQRELVGVKTGYDIVCVKWRKGPAGAGRCEDGVWDRSCVM